MYLNLLVNKQLLHCPPVLLMQTSMVDTNSEGQGELEVLVSDGAQKRVHLRQRRREGGREREREREREISNRDSISTHSQLKKQ